VPLAFAHEGSAAEAAERASSAKTDATLFDTVRQMHAPLCLHYSGAAVEVVDEHASGGRKRKNKRERSRREKNRAAPGDAADASAEAASATPAPAATDATVSAAAAATAGAASPAAATSAAVATQPDVPPSRVQAGNSVPSPCHLSPMSPSSSAAAPDSTVSPPSSSSSSCGAGGGGIGLTAERWTPSLRCGCPLVLEKPMRVYSNREWERLFGYSQAELRLMIIKDGSKTTMTKCVSPLPHRVAWLRL
jgi:hypothetical protein